MTDALAAKGLSPAYVARFPLGVKDLTAELQAARNAGANAIFSYTVGPENATIALGRQALQWDVPQVGAWPLSFPFFIKGGKDAAEGALMAQTFIAEPSNIRRAAFLSAFDRKFNQPIAVPMAAAQSYDASYLLLYSLFGIRDGKLTGPAVKAALENIKRTYYGVVATYQRPFSLEDKNALSQNMLVMGMVKDGKVTVRPITFVLSAVEHPSNARWPTPCTDTRRPPPRVDQSNLPPCWRTCSRMAACIASGRSLVGRIMNCEAEKNNSQKSP